MLEDPENKYVTFKKEEDILYIKFIRGKRIDLKAAQEIVLKRMEYHQDKSIPIICNVGKVSYVDIEARDYFAHEGFTLIKILALIAKNMSQHVMARHYLETYKPNVPYGVFANKTQAIMFVIDELKKMEK